MQKSLFSDNYRRAIEYVSNFRQSVEISQVDLAKLLGKNQSFISKVENFERRVDLVEFITICRKLGLPKSDLLHLIEDLTDRIYELERS